MFMKKLIGIACSLLLMSTGCGAQVCSGYGCPTGLGGFGNNGGFDGAMLGAGTGAIVGQLSGYDMTSTLIGTGAGGLAGYLIGNEIQKRNHLSGRRTVIMIPDLIPGKPGQVYGSVNPRQPAVVINPSQIGITGLQGNRPIVMEAEVLQSRSGISWYDIQTSYELNQPYIPPIPTSMIINEARNRASRLYPFMNVYYPRP